MFVDIILDNDKTITLNLGSDREWLENLFKKKEEKNNERVN